MLAMQWTVELTEMIIVLNDNAVKLRKNRYEDTVIKVS